jgi:hypothetical protein
MGQGVTRWQRYTMQSLLAVARRGGLDTENESVI